MSNSKFDIRDFRSALGQFPTGVTVITALDDKGQPIGCTASSFNSVSIDPALVLWSVDKSAFSAEIFRNAEYFAVNVLSEDQVAISNCFAGRGEDKFKDVSYESGLGGAPLFEGCGAQFECKTWNVYEGGDHLIIVGEVQKYSHNDSLSPLVFSSGSYAVASPHQGTRTENIAKSGNEFLEDYLLYLLHSTISKGHQHLYPRFMEDCDVTPEQWRILTILSQSRVISDEALSAEVARPVNILSQTLQLLSEKGLVKYTDNLVSLTAQGTAMQSKLFSIAKDHEKSLLSDLNDTQIAALKDALKAIVNV
ncbi:flavin reductase [Pseudocolwellia sp. HL-MZ19]|uniref:flavin reductase n=1 Tax=Pseudocolwellia sp. HL-MZ19 TaxID=3400846 RepID=UPI003CFB2ABA